ncbi:MAG: hypothetical protein GWN29_04830 [Gammaproteobacteria bacterium]|nr:hypothetical protein [Gammaproteobacteria bacterium]NIV51080.1 hypothetical protein [Gammaproteobacteria bacterium]NIW23930.1 hypothetical protein [Gammaproteobacteria bacterium]NIX85023.1 hypothetical protein [Gammaproteobacteria bacterium]
MTDPNEWMARALSAEARAAELEQAALSLQRELKVRVTEAQSQVERLSLDVANLIRHHEAEMRDLRASLDGVQDEIT